MFYILTFNSILNTFAAKIFVSKSCTRKKARWLKDILMNGALPMQLPKDILMNGALPMQLPKDILMNGASPMQLPKDKLLVTPKKIYK